MHKQITGLLIDCGGHIGESIMYFKKAGIYNEAKWDIHTFEPHKELNTKMLHKNDDDVTLHTCAVWIEDGTVDFYLTDGRSDYYGVEDIPWGSSTLMKEKISGNVNPQNKETIPCINLSKFIYNRINEYDYTILKMDIEGAEYAILDHLFETGVIHKIDCLMIEYHYKKINVSLWRHLKLKWRLKKLNIKIIEERKNHTSGSWFDNLTLKSMDHKNKEKKAA